MDNPDNSVSSPSANVFSTALESDITQLDDRFDVSCQEKLAQSEFISDLICYPSYSF